jgi:glycosyltransferase involved in cell wall biosynthesis
MTDLRQRRVLVVEGNPDGHRLYYVSLLVSAATEDGNEVFVATTERAINSSEWRLHLGHLASGVSLHQMTDFSLEAIGELSRDLEIDHVVVPDGDSCAYEIAKVGRWLGHGTIAILVMREMGQPAKVPGLAMIKTIAKRIALQRANQTSRVQIRVLKSSPWRGRSALPVSRDPVSLIRHEIGDEKPVNVLPSGFFWFGVVGSIDPRKNLPLVASAVASLNRKDVGLVVAGQVRDSVLDSAEASFQRIRAAGGRVVVIDRLLEEAELDQIIAELDCVVLAHSNEGPSGILGKAMATGTRIVAAGAATLRADCKNIGVGAQWAPLDERLLGASLGLAVRTPRPTPSTSASPSEFTSGLLGTKA